MRSYKISKLLQKDGWKNNVLINTDDSGVITSITQGAGEAEIISDYVIPGFQNAHSHAFQYAMAGLAEVHKNSGQRDDFWSWREAMYNLALSISPDQMEAIAGMLYTEMVRHGYTNVAEFHYVHHDKDGNHYANLAEMGERLVIAAQKAGINITLVPIFYQKGGFGKDPVEGQKRFISKTTDEYMHLLDASKRMCEKYDHANIGTGIHSMRGVEPSLIAEIARSGPQDIPFHIHIAEQLKEIEDCVEYLGKRPVEWLLENVSLNERFHLVHATHLNQEEIKGIAESRANVVLCPTTEGNLGDGIFPLIDYQNYGGNWSIGTDSHIGINPLEELRLLDYGQRLITHKRNTFAGKYGDSGRFAIEMGTVSGRKAMNDHQQNYFSVGSPFNACIIDSSAPLLQFTSEENLLSSIVYSSDVRHIKGTIVNGKYASKKGISANAEEINQKFIHTLAEIGNRQ